MSTKFSDDIVPLSDLKVDPDKVVKHAAESHRPILVTSHGRGIAVVQSLSDYEKAEEEQSSMRAERASLTSKRVVH
jgi:prevent-host-death family protein